MGYAAAGAPVVGAGTPSLDVALGSPVTEVWTTGRPVTTGGTADLTYGHDGDYAFLAGRVPPSPRYAPGVRRAYLRAFGTLADLGYPHVFRIWNFIGDINGSNAEGLEIYRDFCRGRAEAFETVPPPTGMVPAATGVGAHSPGIGFYLLARREPGHTAVENPRQLPAYRYPDRYGPRPPSFARASRLPGGPLLISGTASILGHRTRHARDPTAQLRTTLANLAVLAPDLSALRAVKVYVRHAADLDEVRSRCAAVFREPIACFVTDLCRSDLLVEIEGIAPGRA
ncbi:hypothetical protein [Actinoplanes auranticolor]|uniref:Pteridine-dependent deoxygenase like protein n=1 Tax=Actinoplanes auranticolor TaxID=47988 RepID=A0A919STC5_9ACTN|nr:hypothetical protein [Actinoplanes auranticolor]GIM78157.1 pteridine-dependent deoxygenase like protein [Actinoplanes auranticolor]